MSATLVRHSSVRESKRSSSAKSVASSMAGNFTAGSNPFVDRALWGSIFDQSRHYLPIRTYILFASIRKFKAASSLPRSSKIFSLGKANN